MLGRACPRRRDTTKTGTPLFNINDATFIAISESTLKDLVDEKNLSKRKIHKVYIASDKNKFKPVNDSPKLREVRLEYKIPHNPYFLSLCTLEPRKNLVNTIEAFLLLLDEIPQYELNLVIAGGKGWKYKELISKNIRNSKHIIFTGYVSDQYLAALYSGALAFCYNSYYEGFGLPALEAMTCGIPVIYGNNSSMPEIIGDAGLPVEPSDIYDIKEQMKLLITDRPLREKLAKNALRNASKFDWKKTAQETIQVYEEIVSQR